jgi:hypothetical protein
MGRCSDSQSEARRPIRLWSGMWRLFILTSSLNVSLWILTNIRNHKLQSQIVIYCIIEKKGQPRSFRLPGG